MNMITRRNVLRAMLFSAAAGVVRPIDVLALHTQPGGLKRNGVRQRILIIGAGIAGLVAAYELTQSGHDVILLEANDRVGGRVHTIREPFTDGLYAEAGAARIPDTHELSLRYIDHFGLDTTDFAVSNRPNTVQVEGTNHRSDNPDLLALFGCTPEEQRLGPGRALQRVSELLSSQLGDLSDPQWPSEVALSLDRMNSTELFKRYGVSDGLIRFLDMGFGVLGQLSGLDLAVQLESLLATKLRIAGGNDQLPRAIAGQLVGRIRYHAPVTRILQTSNSVRVLVGLVNQPEWLEADRVIVTAPLSVMRNIEFSPQLNVTRKRAIDRCQYARVTRVFAEVSDRFWEQEGLSGFAVTDHPFEIFNSSYGSETKKGLLMGYFHEELARNIDDFANDSAHRYGVTMMADVFPQLKTLTTTSASYSWEQNPWARGAVALWRPGDFETVYPQLAVPEGKVHFAGEHTSPWHSWIQGAIHSGIRVAMEVNAA